MTAAAWIVLGQQAARTTFRFARIESPADWIVPVAVCAAILVFVWLVYRRDAEELGGAWAWTLRLLRSAVIVALLAVWLEPEWRSERAVVRPSRVVLAIDTSLSMGLVDVETSVAPGAGSRSRQVAALLAETPFLAQLRRRHDVAVVAFDSDVRPLALLERTVPNGSPAPGRGLGAPRGQAPRAATVDWYQALRPRGRETRIGQALRQVLDQQRSFPLAGVVLVSDGRHNAGVGMEAAIQAAREAAVPIFTIGIGSDRLPANARVYRLEVAPRAYPGDPVAVTALVQGYQLAGQTVTAELYQQEAGADQAAPEQLAEAQQIVLGEDGQTVPVKFELTFTKPGRKRLILRLRSHRQDRNPNDDVRDTEVEVVDRQDRVLLFAGGPTREYRFLRSLLYRERAAIVDVLLQTAQPGISQDADAILDDFPTLREEMYRYDCLVAIDPDWNQLTDQQVGLLESWVSQQGGGLVVIAGPVYAGQAVLGWVESERLKRIRDLYPVRLPRSQPLTAASALAYRDPWPLEFTREGLEAEYLWLEDSAAGSQAAWASFPGVYRCYPAFRAKPAATVLAHFSDPRAARGNRQPIFLAEQFYGAGRVFYLGSGEMWRLRALDESYFERFYTAVIRHVAQGRLLRQSSRGTLIIGHERCVLGTTVQIRAQLTDARLQPLDEPTVRLEIIRPNASVETVTLHADPDRVGTFAGQLTVLQEGLYRLELPVPESDERLTRRIQVTLPDREREKPTRNDALLARVADRTGGKYYRQLADAAGPQAPNPLAGQLKDRTETVILTTPANPLWEKTWLKCILAALCTLLCTEWLLRRLLKLA